MSDFDFRGLNAVEQRVLTFQGWRAPSGPVMASMHPQVTRAQMARLVERGLVAEREVTSVRGGLPMTWWEFDVPIPVHFAWCVWADENLTATGRPKRKARR